MPRRLARLLIVLVAFATRPAKADEAGVNLDRPILVVTAAPPLDAERLADALRAYLDEFRVEVRTAPAAPGADLRAELAATAVIGAAARAWAIVRIADGAPGTAEIELVDRVTSKALVTAVPRPRRDEDLYRSVALKVQSLLRATLAEASPTVSRSQALAQLARAEEGVRPAERRFSLETSFAFVGFPKGGLTQQGLGVSLARRFGERLELAAGAQALSAIQAQAGAVNASVSRLPLSLAARLVARGGRWEATAGIVAEAALVSIDTASPTLTVRSGWSVAPAMGAQAGGRVRLGDRTWLSVRAAALGVIVGQRFTAQGQPLLSLSGLEAAVEAGVGMALW